MPDMPYYTQEEDNWLRKNYHNSDRAILLKRFPTRTLGGVRTHAQSRLGLKKDKDSIDLGREETSVIGHLSESEKSYLAGIIDGEGCIMLARKSTTAKIVYSIRVTISNTSLSLEKWIKKHLPSAGRFVYVHRSHRPKWRDCWHWTMRRNRQCLIFLSEIAPYLVIKREQAKLLSNGYIALDDRQREELYVRLSILKRTN